MDLAFFRGRKYTKYWLTFWSLLFIISFFNLIKVIDYKNISTIELNKDFKSLNIKNKFFHINNSTMKNVLGGGELLNSLEINFQATSLYKIKYSLKKTSKLDDISFKIYKNGKIIKNGEIKNKTKTWRTFFNKNSKLEFLLGQGSKEDLSSVKIEIFKFSLSDFLKTNSVLAFWIFLLFFTYKRNQSALTIALFFTLLLFMKAEKTTFGQLSVNTVLAYSSLLIAINLFLIYIYSFFNKKNLKKFLTFFTILFIIALNIIPLIFIIYDYNFGFTLTKVELYAIFQTNFSEGKEFLSSFIKLSSFFILSFILLLLAYIIFWHRKSKIKKLDNNMIFSLFFASCLLFLSYDKNLNLFTYIEESKSAYLKELEEFQKVALKREEGLKGEEFQAQKYEKGELYVVVIGESLNKNHMELYGYPRETSPNLEKLLKNNELLKFDKVYSNHTHTMPTLSLALTQASMYNDKTYYNSLSIVDILNAADFYTVWLTNQALKGEFDNLVSVLATRANKLFGLNKSFGSVNSKFDGDLLPYLNKNLFENEKDDNEVIFLHLMGSHIDYCARFPKEFSKFNDKIKSLDFGNKIADNTKLISSLNCYDNSVLYNDFVVSSIIQALEKTKKVSALLYFSDHADDVFKSLGHNSGNFTFDMTQIPMLAYFSPSYKEKYPEKYENILKNKEKLFSNDMIYDTLLGIMNVKTKFYEEKFDLSSDKYELLDENAKTLHGKKFYNEADNIFYYQRKNADFLESKNLLTKVLPEKVSTLGKMDELLALNYKSFASELALGKDKKLYMQKEDFKVPFEDILSNKAQEIQNFYLNFSNLNTENAQDILKVLQALSEKFSLKDKLILEFSVNDENYKIFADFFKISLLLNEEDLQKINEKTLEKIKDNKVKFLTFEARNSQLTQKNILDKNQKNFILKIDEDLRTSNFITNFPLSEAKKASFILAPFKSYFELN